MTIKQVKAGQLIELEDYNARYRVKVVEVKRGGVIRGQYRVLAVNHYGNIGWRNEFESVPTSLVGCFITPHNIKLAKSKTL